MNEIQRIIADLEKQRAAIERAIAALREVTGITPAASSQPARARKRPGRRKRRLTPEGRARIAEATRRRWAAKREADATRVAKKTTAKKAAIKKNA